MKNKQPVTNKEEFDVERSKYFISLSPKKKLEHLEELNLFLNRFIPAKNKKIMAQMRRMGSDLC